MTSMLKLAIVFLVLVSTFVLAADASERRFVREGMSEGEVLMKIGKPDSESADTGGGAKVTVKRWIYLPTAGDSQMLTTLTIREGKVVEVNRQISR